MKKKFKLLFEKYWFAIITGIASGLVVAGGLLIKDVWVSAIIIFLFAVLMTTILTVFATIDESSEQNKKQKISKKISLLLYLLIFIVSIFIFFGSVIFLGSLVHPLVLSFSLIAGAVLIILCHSLNKREFKDSLWSFSKFFFVSTIFLFIFVLLFSSYGLSKGVNLEPQNVSFDVYVINNALSQADATSALNDSNLLWNKYNISIITDSISYKEVNLSSKEILFLFNNGSTQEECQNYSRILTKMRDNSTNLSIIFLNNLNSGYAGRGCLCNCTFALVSPEKIGFIDFTGWDVAHEIGHILGLSDIQYYGRIKENLMNDETKKLFFFNSNFLDQAQINNVIKKIKSLNQ